MIYCIRTMKKKKRFQRPLNPEFLTQLGEGFITEQKVTGTPFLLIKAFSEIPETESCCIIYRI